MADVAKPSSATLPASNNGAATAEDSQKTKPEKPDEHLYKDSLAKAEGEYTVAQEKLVRVTPMSIKQSFEFHSPIINPFLLLSQDADR